MNSKGTQPCIYMYPFSPKLPSHPGAGRFLTTGPSREVLRWRFLSPSNFPRERNDSYSGKLPQTTPTFMLMRRVAWAPLIALGPGLAVLERRPCDERGAALSQVRAAPPLAEGRVSGGRIQSHGQWLKWSHLLNETLIRTSQS